jgi:hypothetical protein
MDVPVLVSSSRVASAGDRLGPLVLGATEFLPKPVNRIELEHKVETLLRLRRAPGPRFEGSEAEALFGRTSSSRVLEPADFRDRVARACTFGDRHGLESSVVQIRAADPTALDAWIETANEDLRFEDAVLRQSKDTAVVLLVATGPSDATKVIARTTGRCEDEAGHPVELEFAAGIAGEWLDLEALAGVPPGAR